MRRTEAVVVTVLALLASCASTDRPVARADPEDVAWTEEIAPWNPCESGGYEAHVRRVLLGGDDPYQWPEHWIVLRPSLSFESAITLTPPGATVPGPALDPDESRDPTDWTLCVATTEIWNSVAAEEQPDWSRLSAGDFDVDRRRFPVPAESALAIAEAWRLVVRRARHAAPVYELDANGVRSERAYGLWCSGTDYELRGGAWYGQTRSPWSGPAADLVMLLEALTHVGYGTSAGEWDATVRMSALSARELVRRIDALPW